MFLRFGSGYSFCLTLILLHEIRYCKSLLWKALRFQEILCETFFNIPPKTHALEVVLGGLVAIVLAIALKVRGFESGIG
jgi:hypothetical protein